MKNYIFRSLDGVGIDLICDVFNKMLSDEMVRVRHFNYNNYEWCIGVDVVQRINDLRGWRPLPIETGPNSILGIRAEKRYGVKPNEIVLELKRNIREVDVASMYPRFTVDPRGNGKSMMQLRYSEEMMKKITFNNPELIKNVIFNDPATIVFWNDGTKTVVKAENEEFDPEKGLAMAISKKFLGNKGNYYETFKKWLPEKESELKSVWPSEQVSLIDIAEKFRKACETIIPNTKNNIPKKETKEDFVPGIGFVDLKYDYDGAKLMTVKEFAERSGVSVSTIRTQLRNGQFPEAFKENGKWFIPVKDDSND